MHNDFTDISYRLYFWWSDLPRRIWQGTTARLAAIRFCLYLLALAIWNPEKLKSTNYQP
jgi:hypothetical protein